jgi:hypothetical protein
MRKLIIAGALSMAILVGISAESTAAARMTTTDMTCALGTGTVHFSLPLDGAARYSIFYYSVDGGAWNVTQPYFSQHGQMYIHNSNGTFSNLGSGGGPIPVIAGRGRTVVGWELFYSWATGRWDWNPLSSCTTSNFVDTYDTYIWR